MQWGEVLTVIASAMFAVTSARVFEACGLARQLKRFGIPKEHISTWVCIAYHGSHFDTRAWNRQTGEHGILQISELFWCGQEKACGVTCEALRDDYLDDDVKCALHVHSYYADVLGNGFLGWSEYTQHCRENTQRFLDNCFDKLQLTN